MTLIIILCACFFDRFLGWPMVLWRLRVRLLSSCLGGFERLLGGWGLFRGPTGVVLYCAPFLLLCALVFFLVERFLGQYPAHVLQWLILIAGLGPQNLVRLFGEYFHAGLLADQERIDAGRRRLLEGAGPGAGPAPDGPFVLRESGRRLFSVLFWFVVLDVYGVLLYALARDLGHGLASREEEGFRSALGDLQVLLDWPVVRLMALGSALAGDFTAALTAWRGVERMWGLGANEAILSRVFGASLGSGPGGGPGGGESGKPKKGKPEGQEAVTASLDLTRRVLLVWLVVIALLSIAPGLD